MWQRFSERARKVVFYAQEEAQNFGEGYVSTEHLLLGLVRESDSVAARVLEKLGVSLNRIRSEVEKQLPRGDARPNQDMTLTPRAKRVIDLAYDEARNLNNNYIGTEHLLLGLIREGDGIAGRVLAKLGIDLSAAQFAVTQLQDPATPKVGPLGFGMMKPEPAGHLMTPSARRAPVHAVAAAHALGEGQISTEHVLLGLIHEPDSAASRILHALGIPPAGIKADIEERVANFEGDTWALRWAARVARVLTIAGQEAEEAGASRVGTGHLLLAILLEEDGLGAKVLRDHLAQADTMRIAVTAQAEDGA